MSRAYYQATLEQFLTSNADEIVGHITRQHSQQLEHLQTGAWLAQIDILQQQLALLENRLSASECYLFFEFVIPRMGRRADTILVYRGLVFVIEFKVGTDTYHCADIDQAHGYAIDLKNFHQGSHDLILIPVLVATKAEVNSLEIELSNDRVAKPVLIGEKSLRELILLAEDIFNEPAIDAVEWSKSGYRPTPTIVEAAQALYSDHSVEDISRSDAGAKNIAVTSDCLLGVIHKSREAKRKSICFVTGVPGAGKTLVGLNIATQHSSPEDDEYSVFLSGNGPLVDVLREALARDESSRTEGLTKAAAFRRASQFIQNIHHFRDEAINSDLAPVERVVIFDEAQRAWDKKQTSKFMQSKRGLKDFDQSEPEFLIEVMDRHNDWCVVIALIGGGQEINTGEAGIKEWFDAIGNNFKSWDIYCSTELDSSTYVTGDFEFNQVKIPFITSSNLHLSTSMRSFRSEKLSTMVHYLVAGQAEEAKSIYEQMPVKFPVVVTRDLNVAKEWIKKSARANETKGVIASSGALRLKPEGVFVKNRFNAREWFLNDASDIRSCHYLEDAATEFDIQGLELDWCLVGWDADYRYVNGAFEHWQFVGAAWQRRRQESKRRYLENTYRVLLTRARQGMVIFIPSGDAADATRPPSYYDETYNFLKMCGISDI